MTLRQRIEKNLLFLAVTGYYLAGYFWINEFTAGRGDLHSVALPYEGQLPFVPYFIFAYLLVFAYVSAAYLAVDDLAFFKKVVQSFLVCVTFHFIVFLLFPVEYTLRPTLEYAASWINKVVVFYYWMDLPYNSFPSMHISNVFLVSFLLNRYRPGWGKVLMPVACLVAISVVLVKQHYIADVVSGFFVGWGVFRLVFGPAQTRVAPPLPTPR